MAGLKSNQTIDLRGLKARLLDDVSDHQRQTLNHVGGLCHIF